MDNDRGSWIMTGLLIIFLASIAVSLIKINANLERIADKKIPETINVKPILSKEN